MKELRNAVLADFEFFYDIKSEDKNMFWTGHDQQPDKETLLLWFTEKIADNSDREILIYFVDGERVGYSYVIYGENSIETAVSVSVKFEGKGFGKEIVKKTVKYCTPKKQLLYAWILEDNVPSAKIHHSAGYIKTLDIKTIGKRKMSKYIVSN